MPGYGIRPERDKPDGGNSHEAGYFMGDELYPPRDSNPRGFFENDFINGINEKIMMNYDFDKLHHSWPLPEKKYSPFNPGYGHRWLAYIPTETRIERAEAPVVEEINLALAHENCAYKDPRFNYTLNVWKPYLDEKVMLICMFRDPEVTIQSVMTECRNAEYLSEFSITGEIAGELWVNSYTHLFDSLSSFSSKQFIFIHYKQLVSGEILPRLSELLDVQLTGKFIDRDLDRTKKGDPTGLKTRQLYLKLCELANYQQP